MKRRTLVVTLGVVLTTVVSTAPAWARADTTATETCDSTSGTVTLSTVDVHAKDALNAADEKFNAVAGPILGLTKCHTS